MDITNQKPLIEKLITKIKNDGGRITILFDTIDNTWSMAIEFGREDEESSLYAGASYSRSDNFTAALVSIVEECRL